VSKVATALVLSVALVGTLGAAPQGTAPAKKTTTEQKADKGDKAQKGAQKGETVKPADLPKAVTDAAMKAHPKGTIESATKSMMGADTVYTVHITDAGAKAPITMRLKADGTAVAAAGKGKGKGK